MVRFGIRVFLLPASIALLDLLILAPIVLSLVVVVQDLTHGKLDEPLEILESIGVVLIGWGVALEERPSIREIFGLVGTANEEFERGIDSLCHSSGVGILIFGLFSEICVAAVRLPNEISPTEGFDPVVLYIGAAFVVLGAYVLVQHIVRLAIALFTGRVPAAHARH